MGVKKDLNLIKSFNYEVLDKDKLQQLSENT